MTKAHLRKSTAQGLSATFPLQPGRYRITPLPAPLPTLACPPPSTQYLRRRIQHQPSHGALMDEEHDGQRIGDRTGQQPGLEGAEQEA